MTNMETQIRITNGEISKMLVSEGFDHEALYKLRIDRWVTTVMAGLRNSTG